MQHLNICTIVSLVECICSAENSGATDSAGRDQREEGGLADRFVTMGKRTLQSLCGASEVSSDQTLWKCLLAEFLGTAILGKCLYETSVYVHSTLNELWDDTRMLELNKKNKQNKQT